MSTVKEELLTKELLRQTKRKEWTHRDGLKLGYNQVHQGDLKIELADVWGFCYGVLYAIEKVGDVLENHPEKQIWVLGDLIHNPHVNDRLRELGATFIGFQELDRVGSDDVVVVPAFGTKKEIFEYLDERQLMSVDTTCPEVREVEEKVVDFNRANYTAVIHGKHEHQESVATSSFADNYLIVRDEGEAEFVCDYIRNGGDPEEFHRRFDGATSDGFDPDRDLQEIGLANQTTMLMNESKRIFEMFREAITDRDGHDGNVESIDTICSATQDRQDAVKNMIRTEQYDVYLVVGGFTSSNTGNLARTVSENSDVPVYHIQDAGCIAPETVTHLPHGADQPVEESNWWPGDDATVGLTAGASTPHSELEATIKRILSIPS